jgi:DNA repair exonuclease SbcCD ATPase subunit
VRADGETIATLRAERDAERARRCEVEAECDERRRHTNEADDENAKLRAGCTGPALIATPNADAGDSDVRCECCGTELDEPHTWRECVAKIAAERDAWIGRIAQAEKDKDEWRSIADGLAAVSMARFDAAMAGKSRDDLDAGIDPNVVQREKSAIAEVIPKLSPAWKALEAERDTLHAEREALVSRVAKMRAVCDLAKRYAEERFGNLCVQTDLDAAILALEEADSAFAVLKKEE